MSDKISPTNNFATAFPELLIEWHKERNGDLSPYDVAPFSGKKVWWKCSQGHEWESTVSNRTGKNKNGCPFCSGKRASDHHNLARLFPDLLNEWCYEKNTSLDPEKITPYSHQKVWWRCSKGHEWLTGIAYRTKQKSGCPYCSGKFVGSDNSLAILHPELAREWHSEKNGNLTPNDVSPGTDRKVWWLCDKGHSWEAAICHRTSNTKATGCPYCSGRNATVENNLKVLFPDLAKEWDFEKNNPLQPEMVKPGSNKKVWWKCINGHEWLTTPNKRTGEGTNCPNCAPQTSRLEIRLFCELKYLFGNNVEWRYKVDGIEVDLFLPKYSIGIEIDGYPWHLNKKDKDIAKTAELLKHGIKLFRLRDSKLPIIEENDIFYGSIEDDLPIVLRLLSNLLLHVNFDTNDLNHLRGYIDAEIIQNNDEYQRIISFLPSPPPEYSLANVHKHLIHEWHYEKNIPLKPENFTPSARAYVWWKCPKGHEYQSFIYNRIKGVGCPYCAGKKISHENNLQTCFPHLVEEWNHEKNLPLTPEGVYHGSQLKVWWKCKYGHEWQMKIQARTRKSSGCPYCSRKLINDDNSLMALFPEIAKQWHPSRNADLTPNTIAPGSSKKVWWKCEKGHEWKTPPYSRTGKYKTNCPFCAGIKASVDNNLKVKHPQLAAQWHYDKNFPFTPEQITTRSSKRFWWKCINGHEWEATVQNRTNINASNCPYCAGIFVTEDNNLAAKYPELIKEWDYKKNTSLNPSNLLPGSSKKVWWKCGKGHSWRAAVCDRTNKKRATGCPYCAGKKVAFDRNFAIHFPELAAQWNYELNLGNKPEEFSPKSGKKVWWKCPKGHVWQAVIAIRANGNGCPVCAGRRIKSS